MFTGGVRKRNSTANDERSTRVTCALLPRSITQLTVTAARETFPPALRHTTFTNVNFHNSKLRKHEYANIITKHCNNCAGNSAGTMFELLTTVRFAGQTQFRALLSSSRNQLLTNDTTGNQLYMNTTDVCQRMLFVVSLRAFLSLEQRPSDFARAWYQRQK